MSKVWFSQFVQKGGFVVETKISHSLWLRAAAVSVFLVSALGSPGSVMAQPQVNINQATLEQPGQAVREISTEELKTLLAGAKPAVLVDVRPAFQYALAHIPGAVNVPPPAATQTAAPATEDEIIAKAYPDKAAVLVLYCAGPYCLRTIAVSEKLQRLGYANLRRYQIGLPVWRALGNTVATTIEGFKYVLANDKTAVFVDARSAEEFKSGTVPGAVNVRRGLHPDQGTRVIVFGSSAAEARKAAAQIAETAYWNSSYFNGTFEELKTAGLW